MKRVAIFLVAILIMSFLAPVSVFAAGTLTYEQRINALEITPRTLAKSQEEFYEYQKAFFDGVFEIADTENSNYEKLQSTFLYVSDYLSKQGGHTCNSYTAYLTNALYLVGFETYSVTGLVRSKDPNYQVTYYPNLYHNIKGRMGHEWACIVIDGKSNAVLTDYYNPDPKALSRGVQVKPSYSDPNYIWTYAMDLDGNPLEINGEVLYLDANLYAEYGMSFEQTFLIDPMKSDMYSYAYLNLAVW